MKQITISLDEADIDLLSEIIESIRSLPCGITGLDDSHVDVLSQIREAWTGKPEYIGAFVGRMDKQ